MTVEHINFYENLKEAHIRLRNSVVLYEGEPYYIWAITDHKGDGVFRVYMEAIGNKQTFGNGVANVVGSYPPNHEGLGPVLDEALKNDEVAKRVLRKMMNSPLFNKFRPFPLGMCNIPGVGSIYLERQPTRNTQQGLTRNMVFETPVTTGARRDFPRTGLINVDITSAEFRDCVLGRYPSAEDCLKNLRDPDVTNEAGAFHRDFALVRGPVDMIFLAYKGDVVGVLPNSDFSKLRLGMEFIHTKEVVSELRLFRDITYGNKSAF